MDRASQEIASSGPHPLVGVVALVTGVSRRGGIGFATSRRLAAHGASVFLHHWAAHDEEQDWGSDDLDAVLAGVREHLMPDAALADTSADLSDPDAPAAVVEEAVAALGHVDALVCNHAVTGRDAALGELTGRDLDWHWAVDARSCLLLAQAFLAQHDPVRQGSIVFMTSGQALGPLPGEVGYAAAKAALAGVTTTLADQLADANIRINTVNPGPVDTGYLTQEMRRQVAPMFPFGRLGEPDDPARLIAWLVGDEARWITGQVIDTEGGFGRWRPRGS